MCAKTRKRKPAKKQKAKGSRYNVLIIFLIIAVIAALFFYFFSSENNQTNRSVKQVTTTKKRTVPKQTNPDILNGTWVSTTDGRILDIKNQRFSIELPSVSDHEIIKGSVHISGNTVSFHYTSQKSSCGNIPGIYKFSLQKGSVRFRVIKDNCPGRKQILNTLWNKF